MTYCHPNYDKDLPTVWITTNSPGELSTWVAPVVRDLQRWFPNWQIGVALVPCQYASGNEAVIASQIPGVHLVLTPKETLSLIASLPIRQPRVGVVLALGGDPLYAKLLGWKWRVRVVAYTEHNYRLGPGIDVVLRKSVIGDLMASRFVGLSPVDDAFDVVFYTGSRPPHFALFGPFCLAVARKLSGYRIAIQKSPFISDSDWQSLRHSGSDLSVSWCEGPGWETLRRARLAVMLPGSSTAEAAYLQVPMLVVVPLNRPDLIQLDGLLGLVGQLPGFGTVIKRIILQVMKRRRFAAALPNRMAGRPIVPEIQSVVTVEGVADSVREWIENPEQRLRQREALAEFVPTDTPLRVIRETLAASLSHK